MKGKAYMPRPQSDHWCTPPGLVARVHEAFGGPPDLDPCSNVGSHVQARRVYTRAGLEAGWGRDGGTVFVNPPFSTAGEWAHRCAAEGGQGKHVILLLKAATETYRWDKYVTPARVVCFLFGRVTFWTRRGRPAPSPCPYPVAMIAWNTPGFERAFEKVGSLWAPLR